MIRGYEVLQAGFCFLQFEAVLSVHIAAAPYHMVSSSSQAQFRRLQ